MFQVKGTNLVIAELDLWVRRQEAMIVSEYRRLIWATLRELVRTTPQFSGHAAANWNLGVGHPDNDVHNWEFRGLPAEADPRSKGDVEAWMAVSQRYGGGPDSSFMRQIHRRTKVYFCNGVYGDDRWGDDNTVLYLAEMQNPSWQHRLRIANMPYETAEEVISRMNRTWKYLSPGAGASGAGFGNMGGNSFDPEFA